MGIVGIERYDGSLDNLYQGLGIQKGSITRQLDEVDPNTKVQEVLSRNEIYQIEKAISFKFSDLPMPIGWLKQKSVIADFAHYGIKYVGECMPYDQKVVSKLAAKYGADRLLPVSEFTLSGITKMNGRPYPNPKRSTIFFQLPKSINEYPLGV